MPFVFGLPHYQVDLIVLEDLFNCLYRLEPLARPGDRVHLSNRAFGEALLRDVKSDPIHSNRLLLLHVLVRVRLQRTSTTPHYLFTTVGAFSDVQWKPRS